MQENKNNKTVWIISGVAVVILLSVFAFIILSGNKATSVAPDNSGKISFPSLNFNNILNFSDGENTSNSSEIDENINQDEVLLVWDKPALGAQVMDDKSVVFVDRATGDINTSAYPYTSTQKVGSVSQGCLDAKFSTNAKQVLVLCSSGLYLWADSRFVFINQTAFDFDFIHNTSDFVFLSKTTSGTDVYISKQNKITLLYSLPLSEVSLLPSNKDYIYITEKPGTPSQKLFVYSFKNKDLYFVGDLAVSGVGVYQKNFIKEKCVNYNEATNVCFGQNFDSFDFTSWRKGSVSSVDRAYLYLLSDNKYVDSGALSRTLDTYKVGINSTSSQIYLIDKNTDNLFITGMDQLLRETEE